MTAYLVALLIVGGAVILGRAACRACGTDAGIAPAVGLALLVVLASVAIRLPGSATTAAVACAIAVAGAGAWLVRARDLTPDWAATGAAAVAAGLTTLQFLSAGRVGLPGMSLNNDTSVHLLWAEGMRSELMSALYASNPGYPLGPHSLMATVAEGTGLDMDTALTGLLIALPVLFAVVAAHVLRGVPALLRIPAAGFVGLAYLSAAWFGQAAFKEPMMALLLLGFAVGVGDLLQRGRKAGVLSAAPLGVIAGAALLTYSYLAVAWLGLAGALCVVAVTVLGRPGLRAVVAGTRAAIAPALVGALVALAAVAVELPRLWNYVRAVGASPTGEIGQEELGNLAGPLPLGEALGIWPTGDFRFPPPPDAFMVSELKLLVLVTLIGGVAWLLFRRRDLGLLSALGACVILVALSDGRQSPYVTAKALVVLSPFVMLVALRALLPERFGRSARARAVAVGRLAVAAIILAGGIWSSQLVLRSSPVESAEQREQLAELRPLVDGGPTLFLGVDDFAGWRLRGTRVSYVGGFPSPIAAPTRPEKPFQFGNSLDWDSFEPATLDRFRYVIAARGPYRSSAPSNFRPLRSTPLFDAWERVGPTASRDTLDPPDAPVATLACRRDASARRLSRRPGVATVAAAAPVLVSGGLPALAPGAATSVPVSLPPGPWRIAVKYTSSVPVRLQIGHDAFHELPPNTGRPGPWWAGGTLRARRGTQTLVVVAELENRLTTSAFPTSVSGIAAVRPGGRSLVPLRRACGRHVDWYRTRDRRG